MTLGAEFSYERAQNIYFCYDAMLAIKNNFDLNFEEHQLPVLTEVLVATMWLLCFGVPWRNFERVTGRLTPACWVDVVVI